MAVTYWIVAGLLALLYLYAGAMKSTQPIEKLRPTMAWVDSMPVALVRTIGVLELLGAIGLILPPLTGVAPGLATAAAVGLVLIQIGAIVVHVRRGETKVLGMNVVLLVLAAVAVWASTHWL